MIARFTTLLGIAVSLFAISGTSSAQQAPAAQAQSSPHDSSFQCPESFASDVERTAAVDRFLKNYAASNPNGTVSQALAVREHLLITHNCEQTLHYMAAHLSPMTLVLRFVGQPFDQKETEFDAKTHVWTVYYDPEVGDSLHPDVGLIFNFYGWEKSISPRSIAETWAARTDRNKVLYKFQAPDQVTNAAAFFFVGEDLRLTEGYGYADISKIAPAGDGAFAVTYSHRFYGKSADDIEAKVHNWLLTLEAKAIETQLGGIGVSTDWKPVLDSISAPQK